MSKYKFTRLLKTTDSTKISLSSDGILVAEQNLTDSNHETVTKIISSIELNKVVQNHLCRKYILEVNLDGDTGICSVCSNMTTIDDTMKR